MKVSFDDLKNAASDSGVAEAAGEAAESAVEDATTPDPTPSEPHVSFNVGPDGIQLGGEAPAPEMSVEELMNFAQEMQQPSLKQELVELAKDPEVRRAARVLWHGTDEGGAQQAQQQQPAQAPQVEQSNEKPQTNTQMDTNPQAASSKAPELNSENVYTILVVVLNNISSMKPDMTASEMVAYASDNEELIKQEMQQLIDNADL